MVKEFSNFLQVDFFCSNDCTGNCIYIFVHDSYLVIEIERFYAILLDDPCVLHYLVLKLILFEAGKEHDLSLSVE